VRFYDWYSQYSVCHRKCQSNGKHRRFVIRRSRVQMSCMSCNPCNCYQNWINAYKLFQLFSWWFRILQWYSIRHQVKYWNIHAICFQEMSPYLDSLCGLVVRVPGYRYRGPGFDSRCYQIFWEIMGLERGPLRLVSTIEEPRERKSSSSGLESREYGRRDLSRWPRGTLYPQNWH
jgi:hypothetical protein